MKLKLLLLCLFSISFMSCKPQQFTVENLPDKQLVFGRGGGITGAVDTYILLENGQLFHTNSITKKSEELKKVGKAKTQELFNQLEAIQLGDIDFNHPGNMYYFIEDVSEAGSKKVVWGNKDYQVEPLCKILYTNLIEQLK